MMDLAPQAAEVLRGVLDGEDRIVFHVHMYPRDASPISKGI